VALFFISFEGKDLAFVVEAHLAFCNVLMLEYELSLSLSWPMLSSFFELYLHAALHVTDWRALPREIMHRTQAGTLYSH
jgi:hypothetical protein